MSSVAVCTDASALVPEDEATRRGLAVVPIPIALDGEPFAGGDDAVDDFYARLIAGARASTSQPSPGSFLAVYEAAAEREATEVLSFHLDARVSGTVRSAELAARDASIPVRVVETGAVGFGVGVCVRAAIETLERGGSAGQAAAVAREVGATLRNVFVTHAGPRGRVPDAEAWSVLEFSDGRAIPLAGCADVGQAIEAMVRGVFAEERSVRVAVGHAAASTEPAADALALALGSMRHVVDVERYRVGPAVGAHTGPLSFGAFWWPA